MAQLTRMAAFAAMESVLRTGSHLLQFVAYVRTMRKFGPGLRKAVARWLSSKTPDQLGYQLVKYRNRAGWTMRDLFRMTKPGKYIKDTTSGQHDALLGWAARGVPSALLPQVVVDHLVAMKSDVPLPELAKHLPREAIPTAWLKERSVLEAMLPGMPMTAMIRNLANMTRAGLFEDSNNVAHVLDKLGNVETLRKARVHPINVLTAWLTYKEGRSPQRRDLKGYFTGTGRTWEPNPHIVRALERAFALSFGNVDPAGSRTLIGLDVSGSMGSPNMLDIPGLTPRMASAALSAIQVATEPKCEVIAFTSSSRHGYSRSDTGITKIDVDLERGFAAYIASISNLNFGATDCALPMLYAAANNMPIDTFVIYTDNETWAGNVHPFKALQDYRKQIGIPAKLVVVGMTATEFTIADPRDAGMMDVVGFDLLLPMQIANFSRANMLASPPQASTGDEDEGVETE